MKISKEFLSAIGWSNKDEDFTVGRDNFSDLEISPTPIEGFHFFFDKKRRRLIKQFVLEERDRVDYLCQVTLIEKDGKFTPRLSFSVRDKNKQIQSVESTTPTNIKANVILDKCHENFWKLVNYLQTLKEIQLPEDSFSLVTQSEADIVGALRGRDPKSIVNIIKELSAREDVKLSDADMAQLLKRRERLESFKRGIDKKIADEGKWQDFFEANKWIFGYGLKYQILRQEQAQPAYGGTRMDGRGGQRGDYLTSTSGEYGFTVLVEIKTPETPLLHGTSEVRNGAWSLSKDLTDAVAQIQANMQTWDKDGSGSDENKDSLESKGIYTVSPRGIIVIGNLAQLDSRSKRATFERFRRSLHGVEIITFDELYNRARFIVESED